MKQISTLIFFSLLWHGVCAEENCGGLKISKTEGSAASQGEYVFTQQAFAAQKNDEAKQDLVIEQRQPNAPVEIRRVTFARGVATDSSDVTKACYFQPLAFAQGGFGAQFWGWHLLWAEDVSGAQTGGLFYARMDGEAWVSSLPKRLTKLAPANTRFKLEGQSIVVTWQQVENNVTANMRAVSNDEGRSWEINPD